MNTANLTGSLMFFTLIGAALIAIMLFAWFMRKRSNRHPMEGERERNIDEIRREDPPAS